MKKLMLNLALIGGFFDLSVLSQDAILKNLLSVKEFKDDPLHFNDSAFFYKRFNNLANFLSLLNYDDLFSMGDSLFRKQNVRETDEYANASYGVLQYKINVIMPTAYNYIFNFRLLQVRFLYKFFRALRLTLKLLLEDEKELIMPFPNLIAFYKKLDFALESEDSILREHFEVKLQTGVTCRIEWMFKLPDGSRGVLLENMTPPIEKLSVDIMNSVILNDDSNLYEDGYPFSCDMMDEGYYTSDRIPHKIRQGVDPFLKKETLAYVEKLYKDDLVKDLNVYIGKLEDAYKPLIDEFMLLLHDDNSYVDVLNKQCTIDLANIALKFKTPVFFKLEHYFEYCNNNLGYNLSHKVFDLFYYFSCLFNRILKQFCRDLEKDSKFIKLDTIYGFFETSSFAPKKFKFDADLKLPVLPPDLSLDDLVIYIST